MSEINYDNIITQLKSELNTNCAIGNRYGIVLSSVIEEFAKGKVIPQAILDLISRRQELEDELNLKQITSFAVEAESYYYLFTFSEELILISKVDLNVNLAKFMPSISAFLAKLSQSSKEQEVKEFSVFDFEKEISSIEKTLSLEKLDEKKYEIIKQLIKYVSM